MPFQLSPGVAVVEKDFTSIVPAVATSTGGFAGTFQWGPVLDPVTINSENNLVQRFGNPADGNATSFFTAANFLSYANDLLVVRADTVDHRNAVSTKTGGITAVTIGGTNGGYTSTAAAPTITVGAPDVAGGVQAVLTAVLSGGAITAVAVSSGGSGYSGTPTVVITSAAGGSGATFTVTVTAGAITAVTVVAGGSGYKGTVTAAFVGGGGSGASAGSVTVATSSISVTITNAGTGYTTAPTATLSGTATLTPVITIGGIKINNTDVYTASYINGSGVVGEWAAKYPGTLGNSISVHMADSVTYSTWNYKAEFDAAPGTSDYASNVNGSNDEMHIIIIDEIGQWTGTAGSVLEKFAFVSKGSDVKKSDGTNNYYRDVINSRSKYVYWMDHPTIGTNWGTAALQKAYVSLSNSTLSGVTITGEGGQFSCNLTSLDVGQAITISGTLGGTGTIVGYATPTTYYIIATNGTTAFTLSASYGGTAIVTSEGTPTGLTYTPIGNSYVSVLSGGVDDLTATDGQLQTAWSIFADDSQYDVRLLPLGKASATVATYVIGLAETRADCVVFVSPQNTSSGDVIIAVGSDATDQIIAYRNALPSSSYAVLDSGYKYQYDRYNDTFRYIPLNGDIAGLCARTDYQQDPWFSPGGLNRGQIKNVVKLAVNPSKTDRDNLYKSGVNPVVTFPGQGTVMFGDKTLLAKPSAFDRINVRRLFIVLEKSIATAAKFQLFEFNDSFTRAQFKNLVEPFLRDVQGRRGITDFVVKCDDSNNTGEVIDSNNFVADIFIKPNRAINFITLNFVAARSSVSFSEIGGGQ